PIAGDGPADRAAKGEPLQLRIQNVAVVRSPVRHPLLGCEHRGGAEVVLQPCFALQETWVDVAGYRSGPVAVELVADAVRADRDLVRTRRLATREVALLPFRRAGDLTELVREPLRLALEIALLTVRKHGL